MKDLRNKVLEKYGFKSTAEGEKEQAGKTRPPMKNVNKNAAVKIPRKDPKKNRSKAK